VSEVVAVSSVVTALITIALMAYFALRPEGGGPKCPRCDKSVKPGMRACPRCQRTLG
jgi:hypothetical protein